MSIKKETRKLTKLKVYISRDDREMLREKRDYKKNKRISDYHIDAA